MDEMYDPLLHAGILLHLGDSSTTFNITHCTVMFS